jgi:hypothetical protein
MSGITTTHWALFQTLAGIPLSGAFRISLRTVVDSLSRFASLLTLEANEVDETSRAATPTIIAFLTCMACLLP